MTRRIIPDDEVLLDLAVGWFIVGLLAGAVLMSVVLR